MLRRLAGADNANATIALDVCNNQQQSPIRQTESQPSSLRKRVVRVAECVCERITENRCCLCKRDLMLAKVDLGLGRVPLEFRCPESSAWVSMYPAPRTSGATRIDSDEPVRAPGFRIEMLEIGAAAQAMAMSDRIGTLAAPIVDGVELGLQAGNRPDEIPLRVVHVALESAGQKRALPRSGIKQSEFDDDHNRSVGVARGA